MIGTERGPGGSLGSFLWCFGRDRMCMNVQMDSRRKMANVNGDILRIELRTGMVLTEFSPFCPIQRYKSPVYR